MDCIALVAVVQGEYLEGGAVTADWVRDSKLISLSEEKKERERR